ncbi:MAG: prefoldin subunit beta [Nitrosopumilus sp.]|nr:prefoldin subunit beta [Nitrosopumilus sp.]MDH3501367.1 prefoldin subunit beta [Nitrosopumilus sp.]
MSTGQMPPWLQEQLMKLQQSQQNLQSVLTQKQHLQMEKVETEKALEELRKADEDDNVYKHSGSILIKSTKKELVDELEEKLEMAKTRFTVLEKQETRIKETLKEQETKITEMMRGGAGSGAKMTDQPAKIDDPRK